MTIPVPNNTRNYLQVINGFLSLTKGGTLTSTEIEVLAAFIDIHKAVETAHGVSVNPFSSTVKKQVAGQLGRTNYHTLNNYIKSFKDKGVIKIIPGGYRFHPLILPKGSIEFKFNGPTS